MKERRLINGNASPEVQLLRHDIDLTNAVLSATPVHDHDRDAIMSWMRQAQAEQLALCCELERIADSLPGAVDRRKCLDAAKLLCPLIRSIHKYEETVLHPYVTRQHGHSGPMLATLSRLKYEHFDDECYAEELTETLFRLGSGAAVNDEAVGYMLRGFFEGMRRHVAFEKAHLLSDPLPFSPICE